MNLTNFTIKKLITYDKHIFQIMVTIIITIIVIRRSIDTTKAVVFSSGNSKYKTVIGTLKISIRGVDES